MSADKDARIAELERKLSERDEEHDSLVNMMNMEIESLWRKLAEQQAWLTKLSKLGNEPYIGNSIGNCMALTALSGDPLELEILLAKEKEEEREACAEFAEGSTAYTQFQAVEHYKIASFIAAAIRSRT